MSNTWIKMCGLKQRAEIEIAVELGVDASGQAVVLQKLAKGVCGGGKAGRDFDAAGQLGDHLPQAGVLAADGFNVGHPQMLERHDQVGRGKQVGHG